MLLYSHTVFVWWNVCFIKIESGRVQVDMIFRLENLPRLVLLPSQVREKTRRTRVWWFRHHQWCDINQSRKILGFLVHWWPRYLDHVQFPRKEYKKAHWYKGGARLQHEKETKTKGWRQGGGLSVAPPRITIGSLVELEKTAQTVVRFYHLMQ